LPCGPLDFCKARHTAGPTDAVLVAWDCPQGHTVIVPEPILEALIRLSAATAVGIVLGINRDLRGKPTGIRTLGLVALGTAAVTVATVNVEGMEGHPDAMSRVVQGVIQGVLTGIGFIGAGVVLRGPRPFEIHGLTTAANVWLTAGLGIACGLGAWHVVWVGTVLGFLLLVVLYPLEKRIEAPPPDRRADSDDHGPRNKERRP
jgi:putative Mg2+ transporter-C (MgtC) family protein